jgi:tetratricopeptide (TPR) repeat protein
MSEYKKALEIKPGNRYILKQLGFCLKNMGKTKEALNYLKQAFAKDPSDNIVNSTLKSLFKELDLCQEGINYYKKIIRENQGFKNLWGSVNKLANYLENKENNSG